MGIPAKAVCVTAAVAACFALGAVPADASPPPTYSCAHIVLLPNGFAVGVGGCEGGYRMPAHGTVNRPFRFIATNGSVRLLCDAAYADTPTFVAAADCTD
jgi:hypothetical protein